MLKPFIQLILTIEAEWQTDADAASYTGAAICLGTGESEMDQPVKGEAPGFLLSRLIESADSYAIIGFDEQGVITFWSRGAEMLFGWDEADALGKSGDLIFTPEDKEAGVPQEELAQALRKGGTDDVRWHLRRDGSRFWANGALNRLEDGSGFVKIVRDWTEQHRTEQALKASEERQRDIVESATEYAIFTTDLAGIITSWNPGAERVLGYAEGDAIGRNARMIFTPEQREQGAAEQEMREALATGRAHSERTHIRADGQRLWTSQTLMPVREGGGEPRSFLKILRDRTAEKAAEDRMSESEARFRTLAEGIPQLVWTSNDDGHWIEGGPQWCRYTAQSTEETRDLGWLDAVHPDDRERTMEAWHAAMDNDLLEVEHRLARSDGIYQWFGTRAVPLKDGEGRRVEWFGTSTDIHKMKQLEQRQAVLLAELQHRTRNLLAVVRSVAAQTMRTNSSLEGFGEQFQSRLAALGRVQSIIARGDGETSLAEIVNTELLAHGTEASGSRVVVDGPEVRLPASAIQILTLALHELATNALKYGALCQDDGRLSVTWQTHDGVPDAPLHVRLEWRETGVPLGEGFAPQRRGYGRQLIERALAYDLQAETKLQFMPDGVCCAIDVPLKDPHTGVDQNG